MTTTTYPPKFSKKVSILSSVALNSRELPQLPTISPTVRTHSLTTPLLPRFSLVLPLFFVPKLLWTMPKTHLKKFYKEQETLTSLPTTPGKPLNLSVLRDLTQDSWNLRRILRNVPDFWAFTYQLVLLCKHFGTDDVWKKLANPEILTFLLFVRYES